MTQSSGIYLLAMLACWHTEMAIVRAQPPSDDSRTIAGLVMELRSGTPDVVVCLCDGRTGLPLTADTFEPLTMSNMGRNDPAGNIAVVTTDKKGGFRFENVPPGRYRLAAQKWTGPYKGLFEVHGTVIQLMGTANDIVVPRPADPRKARVVLTPPGRNIIRFDQKVGNNSTFMFLSTAPPEYDPVLGLNALGDSYRSAVIGINRMPLGRTTVIGAPPAAVHAFFFAPDSSPGYATVEVSPSRNGTALVPPEPFVAGWSNGRRKPPEELARLSAFLESHSLSVTKLLEIPELNARSVAAYTARVEALHKDLSRTVDLPEGRSARVADLLAVDAYRRLQR